MKVKPKSLVKAIQGAIVWIDIFGENLGQSKLSNSFSISCTKETVIIKTQTETKEFSIEDLGEIFFEIQLKLRNFLPLYQGYVDSNPLVRVSSEKYLAAFSSTLFMDGSNSIRSRMVEMTISKKGISSRYTEKEVFTEKFSN